MKQAEGTRVFRVSIKLGSLDVIVSPFRAILRDQTEVAVLEPTAVTITADATKYIVVDKDSGVPAALDGLGVPNKLYLARAHANSEQVDRVDQIDEFIQDPAPVMGATTNWALLPAAAVAAGSDKFFTTVGTGTEVVAKVTDGGVNIKTQASTPADEDNAMLAAVANTAFHEAVTATSKIIFDTIVNITTITEVIASFGLSENVTDAMPSGTAGEGALFLFDDTTTAARETTGLTAAQHVNWILAHKVNGADTFTATSVPVVADQDYHLQIKIGADLKAKFYIDGVYVGTGPALTSGDTVKAFLAIETKLTDAAGQRDFDCRYVGMTRQIG